MFTQHLSLKKHALIHGNERLRPSKIRYCIAVYGDVRLHESDPENQQRKSVQLIMNNLMRLITNCRIKDKVSIKKLIELTGFLSLNQLTAQAMLLEAWKIIHNKNLPLGCLMQVMSNNTSVVTKSVLRGDMVIPVPNSRIVKESFSYLAGKLWNMAPITLKTASTQGSAKKHIRSFVMTLPI
jgi:hypothetical protein